MSKQLRLSATVAVLSMAFFALAASFSGISPAASANGAANAPLVSFETTR